MTPDSYRRKPKWLRVVSLWVIFSFTSTNLTLAQGPVHIPLQSENQTALFISEKFQIPSELGSLAAKNWVSEKTPFIVFIRDAHAIVDAQDRTEQLIRHLEQTYGIHLVCLEGGAGKLDPTFFRAFPDEKIKRKVLWNYLEKGELTGAQMAAIFSPQESRYAGIEDWKLYEQNYLAYLKTSKNQAAVLQDIERLKQKLDVERKKVYSPEHNEFHGKLRAFKEDQIHLLELLRYLKTQMQKMAIESQIMPKYPELSQLFAVIDQDSSVDQEALEMRIRTLADKFKERYLKSLSKDKAMEFNGHYQEFVTGKLDAANFLKHFAHFAESEGHPLKLSFAMLELLGHSETLSMIRGTKLFEELGRLLEEVETGLAANPEEKKIQQKYERMDILKDLALLEIDRDQLEKFSKDREAYFNLLAEAGAESDAARARHAAENKLAPAVEFYQFALERDEALYRNLRKQMKDEKVKAAIVVLGGFHTRGFEEKLKKENLSYAVVTPKIESLKGHERYSEVMEGKLSYKDFLQTTFYDAFLRHSGLKLVGELNEPDFRKMLKLWRDELLRRLSDQGRIAEASQYTRYIDMLLKAYVEKFGAQKLTGKSKEQILKEIEKELQGFKERSLQKIWNAFQDRIRRLAGGLKELKGKNQLTPQQVQTLLAETGPSKTSTLAGHLGAMSPGIHFGDGESASLWLEFFRGERNLDEFLKKLPTTAHIIEALRSVASDSAILSENPAVQKVAGKLAEIGQMGDEQAIAPDLSRREAGVVVTAAIDAVKKEIPEASLAQIAKGLLKTLQPKQESSKPSAAPKTSNLIPLPFAQPADSTAKNQNGKVARSSNVPASTTAEPFQPVALGSQAPVPLSSAGSMGELLPLMSDVRQRPQVEIESLTRAAMEIAEEMRHLKEEYESNKRKLNGIFDKMKQYSAFAKVGLEPIANWLIRIVSREAIPILTQRSVLLSRISALEQRMKGSRQEMGSLRINRTDNRLKQLSRILWDAARERPGVTDQEFNLDFRALVGNVSDFLARYNDRKSETEEKEWGALVRAFVRDRSRELGLVDDEHRKEVADALLNHIARNRIKTKLASAFLSGLKDFGNILYDYVKQSLNEQLDRLEEIRGPLSEEILGQWESFRASRRSEVLNRWENQEARSDQELLSLMRRDGQIAAHATFYFDEILERGFIAPTVVRNLRDGADPSRPVAQNPSAASHFSLNTNYFSGYGLAFNGADGILRNQPDVLFVAHPGVLMTKRDTAFNQYEVGDLNENPEIRDISFRGRTDDPGDQTTDINVREGFFLVRSEKVDPKTGIRSALGDAISSEEYWNRRIQALPSEKRPRFYFYTTDSFKHKDILEEFRWVHNIPYRPNMETFVADIKAVGYTKIQHGSSWDAFHGSGTGLYLRLLSKDVESASQEPTMPQELEPLAEAASMGQCVTGDTLLPIVKIQNAKIKNQNESGESDPKIKLIPIVKVKPGDMVLSLNENTQRIEPHRIKGLLDMGVKPVFRLTTATGRSIRTTANHPYLVKIESTENRVQRTEVGDQKGELETGNAKRETPSRWIKVSELQVGDTIAVPKEEFGLFEKGFLEPRGSLPIGNGDDVAFQNKLKQPQKSEEQWRQETFPLSITSFLGIQQNSNDDHNDAQDSETYPPDEREFFKKVTGQPHDKNALSHIRERFRDKLYLFYRQWVHAMGIYHPWSGLSNFGEAYAAEALPASAALPSDILWDRIVSIESVGCEHVYDIEVEGTHNFIGNGIFAHNTYIKEAGPDRAPPAAASMGKGAATQKGVGTVVETGEHRGPGLDGSLRVGPDGVVVFDGEYATQVSAENKRQEILRQIRNLGEKIQTVPAADAEIARLESEVRGIQERKRQIQMQIGQLEQTIQTQNETIAAINEQEGPKTWAQRWSKESIQSKINLSNSAKALEESKTKLELLHTASETLVRQLTGQQSQLRARVNAFSAESISEINGLFSALESDLTADEVLSRELNEDLLRQVMPDLNQLKEEGKMNESQVEAFIEVAREFLAEGQEFKGDYSQADEFRRRLDDRRRKLQNLQQESQFSLNGIMGRLGLDLQTPNKSYAPVWGLLLSRGKRQLLAEMSDQLQQISKRFSENGIEEDFIDSAQRSIESAYDTVQTREPYLLSYDERNRWDAVKHHPVIRELFPAEDPFKEVEDHLKDRIRQELFLSREHMDKTIGLGRLLFWLASVRPDFRVELAPILVANAWREPGHSGECPFLPESGYFQENPLYQFAMSLSPDQLRELEKVPGLVQILDAVIKHSAEVKYDTITKPEWRAFTELFVRRTGSHTIDVFNVVSAYARGERPELAADVQAASREAGFRIETEDDLDYNKLHIPNPVSQSIQDGLLALSTHLLEQDSERQTFVMGLLGHLPNNKLLTGPLYQMLGKRMSDPGVPSKLKEEIVRMARSRTGAGNYADLQAARLVLKALPQVEERLQEEIRDEAPQLFENFLRRTDLEDADFELLSGALGYPQEVIRQTIQFINAIYDLRPDYMNYFRYEPHQLPEYIRAAQNPALLSLVKDLTAAGDYMFSADHVDALLDWVSEHPRTSEEDPLAQSVRLLRNALPSFRYKPSYEFVYDSGSSKSRQVFFLDPYASFTSQVSRAGGRELFDTFRQVLDRDEKLFTKLTGDLSDYLRKKAGVQWRRIAPAAPEEERSLFTAAFKEILFSRDDAESPFTANSNLLENWDFVMLLARYPRLGLISSNPANIYASISTISSALVAKIIKTDLLGQLATGEDLNRLNEDLAGWDGHAANLNLLLERISFNNKESLARTGFTVEEVTGLAHDILHAGVVNYVNTMENILDLGRAMADDLHQSFHTFFSNRDIELRVRMDVAEDYLELISTRALMANDKSETSLKTATVEVIQTAFETTHGIMSEIAQAANPSQKRKLGQKITQELQKVRKVLLRYLLGREIAEEEETLLSDPVLSKQVFTVLSIASTLEVVGFKEGALAREFVKQALDQLFQSYAAAKGQGKSTADAIIEAKAKLNAAIIGLSNEGLSQMASRAGESRGEAEKSNQETLEDFVSKGFDRRLWTEGIDFPLSLSDGITEGAKKEQIFHMAYEMVEITLGLGVTNLDKEPVNFETTPTKLSGSAAIKDFYEKLSASGVAIPEDKEERFTEILLNVMGVEARKPGRVEPSDFRVTIRKDFFSEATAGLHVPGCFAPTGIHRGIPLEHGAEVTVFFIQIYDEKNRQVANAIVVLSEEGAYVYSGYNGSSYDMDSAYAKAIMRLAEFVPKVFLTSNSAGFVYLQSYTEAVNGSVVLKKPGTVFRDQYFDAGIVNKEGHMELSLTNPWVLTKGTLERKGVFAEKEKPKEIRMEKKSEPKQSPSEINWQALANVLKEDESLKPYFPLMRPFKQRVVQDGRFLVDNGFYHWVETEVGKIKKGVSQEESNRVAGVLLDFLKDQKWPMEIQTPVQGVIPDSYQPAQLLAASMGKGPAVEKIVGRGETETHRGSGLDGSLRVGPGTERGTPMAEALSPASMNEVKHTTVTTFTSIEQMLSSDLFRSLPADSPIVLLPFLFGKQKELTKESLINTLTEGAGSIFYNRVGGPVGFSLIEYQDGKKSYAVLISEVQEIHPTSTDGMTTGYHVTSPNRTSSMLKVGKLGLPGRTTFWATRDDAVYAANALRRTLMDTAPEKETQEEQELILAFKLPNEHLFLRQSASGKNTLAPSFSADIKGSSVRTIREIIQNEAVLQEGISRTESLDLLKSAAQTGFLTRFPPESIDPDETIHVNLERMREGKLKPDHLRALLEAFRDRLDTVQRERYEEDFQAALAGLEKQKQAPGTGRYDNGAVATANRASGFNLQFMLRDETGSYFRPTSGLSPPSESISAQSMGKKTQGPGARVQQPVPQVRSTRAQQIKDFIASSRMFVRFVVKPLISTVRQSLIPTLPIALASVPLALVMGFFFFMPLGIPFQDWLLAEFLLGGLFWVVSSLIVFPPKFMERSDAELMRSLERASRAQQRREVEERAFNDIGLMRNQLFDAARAYRRAVLTIGLLKGKDFRHGLIEREQNELTQLEFESEQRRQELFRAQIREIVALSSQQVLKLRARADLPETMVDHLSVEIEGIRIETELSPSSTRLSELLDRALRRAFTMGVDVDQITDVDAIISETMPESRPVGMRKKWKIGENVLEGDYTTLDEYRYDDVLDIADHIQRAFRNTTALFGGMHISYDKAFLNLIMVEEKLSEESFLNFKEHELTHEWFEKLMEDLGRLGGRGLTESFIEVFIRALSGEWKTLSGMVLTFWAKNLIEDWGLKSEGLSEQDLRDAREAGKNQGFDYIVDLVAKRSGSNFEEVQKRLGWLKIKIVDELIAEVKGQEVVQKMLSEATVVRTALEDAFTAIGYLGPLREAFQEGTYGPWRLKAQAENGVLMGKIVAIDSEPAARSGNIPTFTGEPHQIAASLGAVEEPEEALRVLLEKLNSDEGDEKVLEVIATDDETGTRVLMALDVLREGILPPTVPAVRMVRFARILLADAQKPSETRRLWPRWHLEAVKILELLGLDGEPAADEAFDQLVALSRYSDPRNEQVANETRSDVWHTLLWMLFKSGVSAHRVPQLLDVIRSSEDAQLVSYFVGLLEGGLYESGGESAIQPHLDETIAALKAAGERFPDLGAAKTLELIAVAFKPAVAEQPSQGASLGNLEIKVPPRLEEFLQTPTGRWVGLGGFSLVAAIVVSLLMLSFSRPAAEVAPPMVPRPKSFGPSATGFPQLVPPVPATAPVAPAGLPQANVARSLGGVKSEYVAVDVQRQIAIREVNNDTLWQGYLDNPEIQLFVGSPLEGLTEAQKKEKGKEALIRLREVMRNPELQRILFREKQHSDGLKQAAALYALKLSRDLKPGERIDSIAPKVVRWIRELATDEEKYGPLGDTGEEYEVKPNFFADTNAREAYPKETAKVLMESILGGRLGSDWDSQYALIEYANYPSRSWRVQAEIKALLKALGFLPTNHPWQSRHTSMGFYNNIQTLEGIKKLIGHIAFTDALLHIDPSRLGFFAQSSLKPVDVKGGQGNVAELPGRKPYARVEQEQEEVLPTRLEFRLGDTTSENSSKFIQVAHGLMMQTILTALKLKQNPNAPVSEFERGIVTLLDEFINALDKIAEESGDADIRQVLDKDWFGSADNHLLGKIETLQRNGELKEKVQMAMSTLMEGAEDALVNMPELLATPADSDKKSVIELAIVQKIMGQMTPQIAQGVSLDYLRRFFERPLIQEIRYEPARVDQIFRDLNVTGLIESRRFLRRPEYHVEIQSRLPQFLGTPFSWEGIRQESRGPLSQLLFLSPDFFKRLEVRLFNVNFQLAYPNIKSFGFLGIFTFLTWTFAALTFYGLGVISLSTLVNHVGWGGLTGLAILLVSEIYQRFLSDIRNGNILDALYAPLAGDLDSLGARVEQEFFERPIPGASVVVAQDILEMGREDFEANVLMGRPDSERDGARNAFGQGYFFDPNTNILYVNTDRRRGPLRGVQQPAVYLRNQKFANNSLFDGIHQTLYIHKNAASSSPFALGFVLAHEKGKRRFFELENRFPLLRRTGGWLGAEILAKFFELSYLAGNRVRWLGEGLIVSTFLAIGLPLVLSVSVGQGLLNFIRSPRASISQLVGRFRQRFFSESPSESSKETPAPPQPPTAASLGKEPQGQGARVKEPEKMLTPQLLTIDNQITAASLGSKELLFRINRNQLSVHPLDIAKKGSKLLTDVLGKEAMDLMRVILHEVSVAATKIGDSEMVDFLKDFDPEKQIWTDPLFQLGARGSASIDGSKSISLATELVEQAAGDPEARLILKEVFIHELRHEIDYKEGRFSRSSDELNRNNAEILAMIATAAYFDGYIRVDNVTNPTKFAAIYNYPLLDPASNAVTTSMSNISLQEDISPWYGTNYEALRNGNQNMTRIDPKLFEEGRPRFDYYWIVAEQLVNAQSMGQRPSASMGKKIQGQGARVQDQEPEKILTSQPELNELGLPEDIKGIVYQAVKAWRDEVVKTQEGLSKEIDEGNTKLMRELSAIKRPEVMLERLPNLVVENFGDVKGLTQEDRDTLVLTIQMALFFAGAETSQGKARVEKLGAQDLVDLARLFAVEPDQLGGIMEKALNELRGSANDRDRKLVEKFNLGQVSFSSVDFSPGSSFVLSIEILKEARSAEEMMTELAKAAKIIVAYARENSKYAMNFIRNSGLAAGTVATPITDNKIGGKNAVFVLSDSAETRFRPGSQSRDHALKFNPNEISAAKLDLRTLVRLTVAVVQTQELLKQLPEADDAVHMVSGDDLSSLLGLFIRLAQTRAATEAALGAAA